MGMVRHDLGLAKQGSLFPRRTRALPSTRFRSIRCDH